MKGQVKIFLLAAAIGAVATSCLKEDDPYRAGFQFEYLSGGVYANTSSDSIVFGSLGPWAISSLTPEATWCQIQPLSGRGNSLNKLTATFEQNKTGQSRVARFSIVDTDHPDKASSSWSVLQTATRGDGSLGNAALVKGITSSDGYQAAISYDQKCRPVEYKLTDANGSEKAHLLINYDENAGVMIVNNGTSSVRGQMDLGYQASPLVGDRDTLGYQQQYYSEYGTSASMNYAFNFVDYSNTSVKLYGILLNGQSLQADSLHCADSLRYVRTTRSGEVLARERLQFSYSQMDNRCQSVDANQLLLGFEECHPMLLLSMFRHVRSTSIVSKATSTGGAINVTTELNPDKSVHRMIVKDTRKSTEVTYTFIY